MENVTISYEFKERLMQSQYSELEEDEYAAWMQSVKATLGLFRARPWKLIIFRIPNRLRRVKEDAYFPSLVSIGPLHHGNPELVAIEERKWRYMLSLLRRTTNPEKTLEECGRAVSYLEESARGCYAENIKFNKNELTEILLLDACFILELFIRYSDVKFSDKTDPIIGNAWMIPTIRYDFTLLENQIPFFILVRLFDIIEKSVSNFLPYSLPEYALCFFHSVLNSSKGLNLEESSLHCKHLLDMLHKLYLPTPTNKNPQFENSMTWGFKHCATKLSEAGVQFKKGTACNLLDVTFHEGVVVIPPLCLDERTDILFRNLIALEQSQCSAISTDHITSYALLMKSLIHSSQDIELLQRKGIIKNCVSEIAMTFFKSLCKEVVFRGFYFNELCANVNTYRQSWLQGQRLKALFKTRCHSYLGALKKDYFSNPWRIISFIAAVLLLILTTLQTIYTMHLKF